MVRSWEVVFQERRFHRITTYLTSIPSIISLLIYVISILLYNLNVYSVNSGCYQFNCSSVPAVNVSNNFYPYDVIINCTVVIMNGSPIWTTMLCQDGWPSGLYAMNISTTNITCYNGIGTNSLEWTYYPTFTCFNDNRDTHWHTWWSASSIITGMLLLLNIVSFITLWCVSVERGQYERITDAWV